MKRLWIPLFTLLLAVSTACGTTEQAPETGPSPTALRSLLETPTASSIERKPLGEEGNDLYGSFVIPRGDLPAALAAATEAERPIMEDGVITFSEYERLEFEAMACLEAGGLAPMHFLPNARSDGVARPGPFLTGRGEYVYFGQALPGRTYADGRRVWDECTGNTPAIEFYWNGVHSEPTEVERQEHRDSIAACLRAAGHAVPEHPSKEDLALVAFPPDGVVAVLAEPEWFTPCHWQANDELSIESVWDGP